MNVFTFPIAIRPSAVCNHSSMAQFLFQVLHGLVSLLLKLQTDVLFWNSLKCYYALPLPSLVLTKQLVCCSLTYFRHNQHSYSVWLLFKLFELSWFCLKWVREHSNSWGSYPGSNQCPRDSINSMKRERQGTNVSNLCSCVQIQCLQRACKLHMSYCNTRFPDEMFSLLSCNS